MAQYAAQAPQMQAPQQSGGMVTSLQMLLATMDSPAMLIYGFIVILLIVYSPQVPMEVRSFLGSLLGRTFGVAAVYGVIETMGWVYGLLTALAFLLVLYGAPRSEGFDGGGTVSEKKAIGGRWFVERVLGERTTKIATDRVITNAITD
jgi:hypothetical protein